MSRPELILASSSPRRRTLLNELGFAHRVVTPDIDDALLVMPPGAVPEHWTAALSCLKARCVQRVLQRDASTGAPPIILAADTIVIKHGRVLPPPNSEEVAQEILLALRDGEHVVATGVTILEGERRVLFVDRATVRVGVISDRTIDDYVSSGGWRGKAGAYNLAERLAEGWPITYEGDPTTIMGLPMRRLEPLLRPMLTAQGAPSA